MKYIIFGILNSLIIVMISGCEKQDIKVTQFAYVNTLNTDIRMKVYYNHYSLIDTLLDPLSSYIETTESGRDFSDTYPSVIRANSDSICFYFIDQDKLMMFRKLEQYKLLSPYDFRSYIKKKTKLKDKTIFIYEISEELLKRSE